MTVVDVQHEEVYYFGDWIMKHTFVRDCTSFCRQMISFLRYCTSLSFALSNV